MTYTAKTEKHVMLTSCFLMRVLLSQSMQMFAASQFAETLPNNELDVRSLRPGGFDNSLGVCSLPAES